MQGALFFDSGLDGQKDGSRYEDVKRSGMEYHGEPVGGVPEGGQQDRGGHGGTGGVEPEHHADHAEADDGKGADCLRGQWAACGSMRR